MRCVGSNSFSSTRRNPQAVNALNNKFEGSTKLVNSNKYMDIGHQPGSNDLLFAPSSPELSGPELRQRAKEISHDSLDVLQKSGEINDELVLMLA